MDNETLKIADEIAYFCYKHNVKLDDYLNLFAKTDDHEVCKTICKHAYNCSADVTDFYILYELVEEELEAKKEKEEKENIE